MRAYEVSRDDEMVVDNEGTIWIVGDDEKWHYITNASHNYITGGNLSETDIHEELPIHFEPYTRLDKAAKQVIQRGLR